MSEMSRQKFDGYANHYDQWFYQTLIKNPMYTNEEPEEVSDGYKSGGYVAIVAHK